MSIKSAVRDFSASIGIINDTLQNTLRKQIKIDILKAHISCYFLKKFSPNKPVTFKIGGYKMSAPNPNLFKFLLHEILISECYQVFLDSDSPVIIDCGSNIGFSVLYFKLKYPKAKIIAVEANPDTAKVLQENVKQFGDVHVYNNAIMNADDQELTFYFKGTGDVTASTLTERGLGQATTVKSIALKSLIGDKKIDLLKMDVEGGEFPVFNANDNHDYLKQIKHVALEYHHFFTNGASDNSMADFLSIFEKNNFVYAISATDRKYYIPHFQDIMIKMKNTAAAQ